MSPKPDIRDPMNKPIKPPHDDVAGPRARHKTTQVMVGNVAVGGGAPIVVQSMTNTDTADVAGTVAQIAALARAGSELVRITVDRDEAAAAVPHIRDELRKRGITTPLIGDFHYIGHKLLADHPACAEALDKYRINPGNVGFKNKRDSQFTDIVEMALKYGKTVRIGANWGSLDQELLTKLMDENALLAEPKDVRAVTPEAMVQSALLSAARAEEIGTRGRQQRRLHHGLARHRAAILRFGEQRVLVHQLGQQFLIERTPIGTDADGLAVFQRHLDDVGELAVALVLEADIAGIDAVFVERLGAGRMIGEQLVADVMEIADQGRGDAALAQFVADMRHRRCGLVAIHRDPHHLGTGT